MICYVREFHVFIFSKNEGEIVMNGKINKTTPVLKSSTLWIAVIVSILLAFPTGYIAGNSASDDADESTKTSEQTSTPMTSPGVYEVPEGTSIPRVVNLQVTKDNKSGWNISFDTENFTFTPEKASSPHVPNEGHAHLHIDGKKISRLYSSNYYVADLEPGEHTFSVYLNTNDHKEYVIDGEGTGEEVVVTQE